MDKNGRDGLDGRSKLRNSGLAPTPGRKESPEVPPVTRNQEKWTGWTRWTGKIQEFRPKLTILQKKSLLV